MSWWPNLDFKAYFYDFDRHQRTSIILTYCDIGFCIVLFTLNTNLNLNVSLSLRISRLQSQVAWSQRRSVTFLERLLGDFFQTKYQGIWALLPNLEIPLLWAKALNWFFFKNSEITFHQNINFWHYVSQRNPKMWKVTCKLSFGKQRLDMIA